MDELHIWARALSAAEIEFLAGTGSPPGTEAEVYIPGEIGEEFDSSGAVFTSAWHVEDTDPAMVLAFMVPDLFGSYIQDVVQKDKNWSTPKDTDASLLGAQTGLGGLSVLITADRGTTDPLAKTLHVRSWLMPDWILLGMQVQWSPDK